MGQIGEKRRIVRIPKPAETPKELPKVAPVEPVKVPEPVR